MIRLNLDRHCIETEMRRLHNRLVDMLLRPGADPAEAEIQLQILQDALNRLDFSRLRTAFPELAGNQRNDVRLCEHQGNRLKLMINDNVIDLSPYYKT